MENLQLSGLFADDHIREKLGISHEDHRKFKTDVLLHNDSEEVAAAFCWGLFLGAGQGAEIDPTDQKQVDAFNKGVVWNGILGKAIMSLLVMWLQSLTGAAWLPVWVKVIITAISGGLQPAQVPSIIKIMMSHR
jgi:hypothetical protein